MRASSTRRASTISLWREAQAPNWLPTGCVGIGVELFPFGAFVIRKKDEAVLIETLQENDSHRRSRVATRRRKAHRVDITNAGLNRGGKPIRKLPDRIRIQVAPAQTFTDVIVT